MSTRALELMKHGKEPENCFYGSVELFFMTSWSKFEYCFCVANRRTTATCSTVVRVNLFFFFLMHHSLWLLFDADSINIDRIKGDVKSSVASSNSLNTQQKAYDCCALHQPLQSSLNERCALVCEMFVEL